MDAKAGAFVAWAKLSNPTGMGAEEVKKYLASSGVNIFKPEDEKPSAKRGPLEVGEVVLVDGSKCLHPENKKNCAELALDVNDPTYCIVVDIIEPKDLLEMATIRISPIDNITGEVESRKYDFKAVYPKRIAGLTKKLDKARAKGDTAAENKVLEELRIKSLTPHDGVGVYRKFSSLKAYQKTLIVEEDTSEKFVVVYERGSNTKVPQLRKEFNDKNKIDKTRLMLDEGEIEDLMDTGIEDLIPLFYSGPIKFGSYNKKGEFYFKMEAHAGETFLNPTLGTVYFISKVSDMSRGTAWLSDLRARLKAQAELELKQLL